MSHHSFTRQELYDLVWSEPMVKLAERYGISGNGLAKACRRADIPVPERGYWAKKQAGRKVSRTPLPAAKADTPGEVTIQPPGQRPQPPEPPPIPASVQEKIDTERSLGKQVPVPKTLSNPHRIVATWLQDDRRKRRESRYDRWSSNLYKPIDGTDLDKRRLRILSALYKALEVRDYKLVVNEFYIQNVQIEHRNEKLELHLGERIKQVRRQLTDKEKVERRYLSTGQRWTQERAPTGELVLKIKEPGRYGMTREWRESADSPLEEKLGEVLAQLAGMFEELRLRRVREAEERARRWEIEEERDRIEMERKRETIRYQRLLDQCKNWRASAEIRAFVAAIEADPLVLEHAEHLTEWKAWALAHADRIDPLRNYDLFDQDVSDDDLYMLED